MTLYREVDQQLKEQGEDGRTVDLVLAALAGEQALERLLEGGPVEARGGLANGGGEADGHGSSVYLQDITVAGFRGIGPEVSLEAPPGPGLTVVVGRNGSGKSSFAEALEVLLTGDSLRWKGKGKTSVWKKGWRNLHQGSDTRITARFQVEGKNGLTTVECAWPEGTDLDKAEAIAQHYGERRSDLAGIGWQGPLELYRPLLSYNELGRIVTDSPSALFDKLTAVLGLESLRTAVKALSVARIERKRVIKEVETSFKKLIRDLASLEDERGEKVITALQDSELNLNALSEFDLTQSSDQEALRGLSSLRPPDEEQVLNVAQNLEVAYIERSSLAGTDAEKADQLIRLLKAALDHHGQHGDKPCPVCRTGILDADWRRLTEEQIDRLRESADRYRATCQQYKGAVDSARSLVAVPSLPVSSAVNTVALKSAWDRWRAFPDDPAAIPTHLLAVYEEVTREAATVSEQATDLYSEREEKWTAVLPDLRSWLVKGGQAAVYREVVVQIEKAEAALKQANESLRNTRWVPIETKALEIWKGLRLQSNVDLRSVELTGTTNSNHRRVDLTVEMDGTEASALAVASQGEFSCLALSLFFPRATLPQSPFRFLVIDDPVQAMDPARVDGLARVFAEIAADRQLIVFTHDDRLPESLRRLDIEHTCIEVTRRRGSVVEVRPIRDPVLQYFRDAQDVVADKHLPEEIARRVIPGICRSGLEAACTEVVRRRRLGRGVSHAEVEQALEKARTLMQKTSLAIFDDVGKAGNQVYNWITRKIDHQFTNAFKDANRGAHGKYSGDLKGFIKDCQELANCIRCQS